METMITMDNFETEVLQSDKPVLIDFYADWCGPCKMMGPIVEQAAEELGDKIKVCKCNVDDNMALAQKYRIVSIPAFKIFKNGEEAATVVGGMPADDFLDWVEGAL